MVENNINIYNFLPVEILNSIFKNTKIRCKCCNKVFNFNFYNKLDKNYYCSKICYNFI